MTTDKRDPDRKDDAMRAPPGGVIFWRSGTIDMATRADEGDDDSAGDDRGFEITLSSETEVERFSWEGRVIEILDHGEGSVRMDFLNSGRAPLLKDHMMREQIGIVDRASLDADRKIRMAGRFGSSDVAEAERRDVKDRIRVNVSVGFRIHRVRLEEETDDRKVYRVVDWEPLEGSTVSIPADTSDSLGIRARHLAEISETSNEVHRTMDKDKDNDKDRGAPVVTPPPIELTEADRQKQRDDAMARESNRVDEIIAYGRRFSEQTFAAEHVRSGTTVEAFRGLMLERMPEGKLLDTPPTDLDMSDRERRKFSIVMAMRLLDTQRRGGSTAEIRKLCGIEQEASAEIEKRLNGKSPQGLYIPYDIQRERYVSPNDPRSGRRDLSVGTDTAGGHLVGTDHLGASFIERLRNALVVRSLGARVLTGLVGNVDIPRRASGTTGGWAATEGANASESDSVFGNVSLTPKTVHAYSDVTRLLMLQSDPSIEMLVRDDMAFAAADAIDAGALNGSGASGQPTGILQTSGIGDVDLGVNGAALAWADIIEHMSDLMSSNAHRGSLAWVMNGATWGKLMSTPKVASTDSVMILDGEGTMLVGKPIAQTENMPSNLTKGSGTNLSASIYGNFMDLLLAEWGILDLLIDPYTNSLSGTVRFVIHQTVDVGVRHAASFSSSDEIVTV